MGGTRDRRRGFSDDPGGGRDLTRRLARVLPAAVAMGLAVGIPLAIVAGEWRIGVLLPLALAAVAGTITAAMEDGRVQRRIDRRTRRDERERPPS